MAPKSCSHCMQHTLYVARAQPTPQTSSRYAHHSNRSIRETKTAAFLQPRNGEPAKLWPALTNKDKAHAQQATGS